MAKELGPIIAQLVLPVSRCLPEVRNAKTDEITEQDTLKENLAELEEEIKNRPWFKQLLDDVRTDKKSAVFKVIVGGIIVTAATAVAYEFGIAHGRDLKELHELLEKHKKQIK